MTSISVTTWKKAISVFKEDSVQIPTQKSQIHCSVRTAKSCIWTPISVEKLLNSTSVHLSGCHGNTSGRFLEFEKIPVFLYRHRLGKQFASIRMTGKHSPDEILDKEVTCRQIATVQTTGQHRPDAVLDKAIMCRQFATVWTPGQHCSDAVLDKAITCRRFATVRTLWQHCLDVPLIWRV
jgi:hypothetical protein